MLMVKRDLVSKAIVFIIGMFLFTKILVPLVTIELNENSKNIFLQIIGKSNVSLESHIKKNTPEDEDNIDLKNYIVENLTGIDLSAPTKLISSQIPLLSLIDITKVKGEDKNPVILVKEDEDKKKEETKEETKKEEIKQTTPKKEINHKKPEVLIYHTHTTEAYNPTNAKGQKFVQDLTKTVARVGDEMEKVLEEKYGIATVHDKTIHDLPTRNGAYQRSRPTLQSLLKNYSDYKIIIDLHRDGGVPVDRTTATINGQKYARPMFVFGSKSKNLKKNEEFARKLNAEIDKRYPEFSRGFLYHKNAVFNLDLSDNIVLLEVGGDLNSLDEALRTINIVADIIAGMIK